MEDIVRVYYEKILSRSDSWRSSTKGEEAMEWLDKWSEGCSILQESIIEESYQHPQQIDTESVNIHDEALIDLPSDLG